MPCSLVTNPHIFCVEIHFDVADVSVDKANNILRVVEVTDVDGIVADMRVVPGVRLETRQPRPAEWFCSALLCP